MKLFDGWSRDALCRSSMNWHTVVTQSESDSSSHKHKRHRTCADDHQVHQPHREVKGQRSQHQDENNPTPTIQHQAVWTGLLHTIHTVDQQYHESCNVMNTGDLCPQTLPEGSRRQIPEVLNVDTSSCTRTLFHRASKKKNLSQQTQTSGLPQTTLRSSDTEVP